MVIKIRSAGLIDSNLISVKGSLLVRHEISGQKIIDMPANNIIMFCKESAAQLKHKRAKLVVTQSPT